MIFLQNVQGLFSLIAKGSSFQRFNPFVILENVFSLRCKGLFFLQSSQTISNGWCRFSSCLITRLCAMSQCTSIDVFNLLLVYDGNLLKVYELISKKIVRAILKGNPEVNRIIIKMQLADESKSSREISFFF